MHVISRLLLVSSRWPSGRLYVAENERRKARLARIGKSSGAELYHHVSGCGSREFARARAMGQTQFVVDLAFFWPAIMERAVEGA